MLNLDNSVIIRKFLFRQQYLQGILVKLPVKDKALSLNVEGMPKTWYVRLLIVLAFAGLIWLSIVFFTLFLVFFVIMAATAVVRLLLFPGSKKDVNASGETYESYISEKNGTKHTVITVGQYDREHSHESLLGIRSRELTIVRLWLRRLLARQAELDKIL